MGGMANLPARDRTRDHGRSSQDFPQSRSSQHVEQRAGSPGVLAIGGDGLAKLPKPSGQDIFGGGEKNRGGQPEAPDKDLTPTPIAYCPQPEPARGRQRQLRLDRRQ